MPTYLAPGVYVEEIAGPRTIQGVSTSTAAFVGPCRTGPTSGRIELLTSYADFQRIYGDALPLSFGGASVPNYLAMGVKGFFDEGGASLYVRRVYLATGAGAGTAETVSGAVTVHSRYPGAAGGVLVTFTLIAGANAKNGTTVTRIRAGDSVLAGDATTLAVYTVAFDSVTSTWSLTGNATALDFSTATVVRPVSVRVDVSAPSVDAQGAPTWGPPTTLGSFGFDPASVNGLTTALASAASVPLPIWIEATSGSTAADIAGALFDTAAIATIASATAGSVLPQPTMQLQVGSGAGNTAGDDGDAPTSVEYDAALADLEAIDDISIVAAPGAASGWGATTAAAVLTYTQEINDSVTGHCERMRYRVACLDTPHGLSPTAALDFRNLRSSNYAALYYPWITVSNPVDGTLLDVPPGAYMAGIWARSDDTYGVIKAPANEVVRSAVDFERRIKKAEQELLNPEGVNCLRFFPGPGFLVWGARTISDDPEWKYLSMRRYFDYVEKSVDEGTQWVVFEVNGPTLWDSVRHTVEGFLLTEWKGGALLGTKPEQAYFVRCDLSTMTQDDLDNGRLICQVGIAAAKPAEFVIFRISQWTATATS